jgi:isocitrate/isopropylmalate dehydrogenase
MGTFFLYPLLYCMLTINSKVRTRDMGGNSTTKEFTRAILGQMEKA